MCVCVSRCVGLGASAKARPCARSADRSTGGVFMYVFRFLCVKVPKKRDVGSAAGNEERRQGKERKLPTVAQDGDFFLVSTLTVEIFF